ncbi:hypothetical protein AOQ84DRAFT_85337 [Glonium stellatum]|uniref:Uncharacterized protein n=1 Tax=Glonium stellatum TaxID=574774 RepID=A0A8E2JXY1_9PEZI|nr:hypothetical protein AOQ84DRAFT_85337 [Glonium stellatum]
MICSSASRLSLVPFYELANRRLGLGLFFLAWWMLWPLHPKVLLRSLSSQSGLALSLPLAASRLCVSEEKLSGLFNGWSALRAYPDFRVAGDSFLPESNLSDNFLSRHDGGLCLYYRAALLLQAPWEYFAA